MSLGRIVCVCIPKKMRRTNASSYGLRILFIEGTTERTEDKQDLHFFTCLSPWPAHTSCYTHMERVLFSRTRFITYCTTDLPTDRPTSRLVWLHTPPHTPTLTIGWLAPPSPVHVHCAQQRGPAISQNHSQLQLFICIEPHSFSFTHKHYVFPRRGHGTATKHRR